MVLLLGVCIRLGLRMLETKVELWRTEGFSVSSADLELVMK